MRDKITSWTVESTTTIKLDNQVIDIKSLSSELRFEIQTFDKIKTDYAESVYKSQVLHLALNAQYQKIVSAIKAASQPKEDSNEKV